MVDNENRAEGFDYGYVGSTARIALYDDMKSAPRITKITPNTTNEYIETLTTTIYDQSRQLGGKLPYTVIREVSENFIHANFKEIVVSILDNGNTIRFADQGPGITEKERAQRPGFSSATEQMKDYIRGVGSGFPIVKDYLDEKNGTITIEDNLVSGAVVTISLNPNKKAFKESPSINREMLPLPTIPLTDREKFFLKALLREGELGITELSQISSTPSSSTFATLSKLEQAALVEKLPGKKRTLTDMGIQVAQSLK